MYTRRAVAPARARHANAYIFARPHAHMHPFVIAFLLLAFVSDGQRGHFPANYVKLLPKPKILIKVCLSAQICPLFSSDRATLFHLRNRIFHARSPHTHINCIFIFDQKPSTKTFKNVLVCFITHYHTF